MEKMCIGMLFDPPEATADGGQEGGEGICKEILKMDIDIRQ